MLAKIWHLAVLLAVVCDLICADIFEECEGKDQTYVEVKEDCSYYILCHGEESFSDSCPDDSPYFSIEQQTCEVNKNVCNDRPVIKTTTTVEEEVEDEMTTLLSSSVTPSSSTRATSSTLTIPTAASFYNLSSSTDFAVASTTTSSATNSTTTQAVTTALPTASYPTACPLIDNPFKAIFLPHDKSCSEYFICYRGERLPMRCSNMLHFDVRQQKCDYPENVKCHMMNVASPREQCLPHTFDLYPHPRNCNYYYQCILGYLKVMQCPLNMGWHYEKRVCVRRSQAKCFPKSFLL